MREIICQKDEICDGCSCELPKGSYGYVNFLDELYCEECKDINID